LPHVISNSAICELLLCVLIEIITSAYSRTRKALVCKICRSDKTAVVQAASKVLGCNGSFFVGLYTFKISGAPPALGFE
jgi:hypothetical protein